MKKKFLLTILVVLFVAIGSVCSVSVAANTASTEVKESSHGRSHNHYWATDSFTVNNRKGVINDVVASSDTSADQR